MRSAKGSIIKLGTNYWRVIVSATDPATGKRTRPSQTVRGSRREAENVKLAMLAKADAGEYGGMMKLADYVEVIFMPSMAGRKPRTIVSMADRLRLYVLPKLGDHKLSDITPRLLRLWLAEIKGNKKQFAAYITLRQVLNHAAANEYITVSPMSKVAAPSRERYEPTVLDLDDIEVYLWHFKGSPIEPAVLLAIGAGLRRGEIIALNVDDINLATGKVVVDDAITQQGGKLYAGDPKSRYGIREVYLPSFITKRLVGLLQGATGAVLTEDGARMTPDRLTYHYRKALQELPDGVPRVILKNLRHTSLTLAYDSGADVLAVSRRAGHSSTKVTTDYYVRPKGSRDIETAKAMDVALKQTTKNGANLCQVDRLTKAFKVVKRF